MFIVNSGPPKVPSVNATREDDADLSASGDDDPPQEPTPTASPSATTANHGVRAVN
jgi:hypothetical protein